MTMTMTDEEIIEEIKERVREMDYPGSFLNTGVSLVFDKNQKTIGVYYPKYNCVLVDSTNKLIKNIHSLKEARELKI